jgi:hypothetical protein
MRKDHEKLYKEGVFTRALSQKRSGCNTPELKKTTENLLLSSHRSLGTKKLFKFNLSFELVKASNSRPVLAGARPLSRIATPRLPHDMQPPLRRT